MRILIEEELEEPVLSVVCDEPEGKILRSVYPTRLSMARMKFLWEKLKGFDTLFNDFVQGDFNAFFQHFLIQVDGRIEPTGLMWDVDDVGMFFMNEIRENLSAQGHFTFWDRRFRGRENLCREMIKYVLRKYNLQRIEVQVPLYSFITMSSMEKIGLVKEGRLRRAVLYKDNWFDMNVYSNIRSDFAEFNTGEGNGTENSEG